MREDFVPPNTTEENKQAAAIFRYQRLKACTSHWHALAVEMGYDGVEPALLALQTLTRNQRKRTVRCVHGVSELNVCTKCD
ncbi:MAG TPA: hypothetical protein VGN07_01555 [Steroidobacteraceae bacterium]|jgi:hypothetical protein